tara:strand:- start:440 stop:1468 length:1029 start_codon:yes stop_codon:yes gene_type:complete
MSLKNLNVKIKIPKFLQKKLSDKKINSIYSRFEKSFKINENFIVAVSGGPDSLALAFLAKIYSIRKKLKPKFFIVDHRLRSGSSIEAKNVKKILKSNSIVAQILTWRGKKPTKNIQSIARNKRYQLLLEQADRFKINSILVGHHQDDLLENFFIRILRGSGLKGLISLDRESKIGSKNLLRPLLSEKKEDLIYLSNNIFNFYVEDPTNYDENYKRIKIRKLIETLQINGLDKKKFIKTINNLKYSNEVVKFYVDKNLKKNTSFSKKKKQIILARKFFMQPYEVIFRSFSDSINLISGRYYPVRGKKLDKIINDIKKNQSFRATLGGCIIEKVNQTVIISKEH